MAKDGWFSVDRQGLAQVYARRGPAAPFFELISNAWDESGVTRVGLTVTAIPGRAAVDVHCEDDSTHGFADLDEARVLFAPSKKKREAEQRGRFNIGEKLFLSLCEQAEIVSTGGRLVFDRDGYVVRSRVTRERGTEIKATMRMTRADALDAFNELGRLISPEGIETVVTFLGFHRETESEGGGRTHLRTTAAGSACFTFKAKLQSELADSEGVLRPTERIANVQAWVVQSDEMGWLYELGIPVVEIGGMFNINVLQKVPLTVDRANVKPAFLRRLRTYMLNAGFARIESKTAATEAWVTEAMGSTNPLPRPEALTHILDLRYGKKRVAYDPSDVEGTQIAVSKGYAVVHGGSLPREVWTNVKSAQAMLPAGRVTPSRSDQTVPFVLVDPSSLEGAPEIIAAFEQLARALTGESIQVVLIESEADVVADYANHRMRLNVRRLGRAWFKRAIDEGRLSQSHVELCVHELGHEYASSHLDAAFHESQTRLGVKLALLAYSSRLVVDLLRIPQTPNL